MDTSPNQHAQERKPWPLRWIALVIGVYIVGYTALNLAFRKSEPPHEPYAEAQERRQMRTIRASMMGWTRLVVEPRPPSDDSLADSLPATMQRNDDPPALEELVPQEVMLIAPGAPHLYPAAGELKAPARLPSGAPLLIAIRFEHSADLPRFGEPLAYAKDGELHLFLQEESGVRTHWEALPAAPEIALSLPADGFTPGDWTATMYADGVVITWSFVVE